MKPCNRSPRERTDVNNETQLMEFMRALLDLMEKHNAELTATLDDDGVHARVGTSESSGFFSREELAGLIANRDKAEAEAKR